MCEFTFLVLEEAVFWEVSVPHMCVCAKQSQGLTGSVPSLQGAVVQVQAAEGAPVRNEHLPTREQQILALQTSGEFDVLVIGGGATGCGCALDAATRGKGREVQLQAPSRATWLIRNFSGWLFRSTRR